MADTNITPEVGALTATMPYGPLLSLGMVGLAGGLGIAVNTSPHVLVCNETAPTFAFDNAAVYVPPVLPPATLDLSTSECADHEAEYIAKLQAEALAIAAGPVNVFPLLGTYNQGSTIDQVGAGYPLSSGTASTYNIANAFNSNAEVWRSSQIGSNVVSTPAFIGYNFGTKKAWTPVIATTPQARERYQPAEPLRKKISTFNIKQSASANRRALQVRVEACDDGVSWKRIDVVSLPNDGNLNGVAIRPSPAAYAYWRFVPIFFTGVADNVEWEVVELQLLESTEISLSSIEDLLLLENRDRAYSRVSTLLKCTYDLLDVQTELARFGINIPQTYIFTVSFAAMVTALGRPVVVGDILEVPGEMQYDANLRPVRKWLEVTDTAWSTEGYAFNWKPQLFKFYGQPVLPSAEHRDILGLPGTAQALATDAQVLGDDDLIQNILGFQATEHVTQRVSDAVPQTGSDPQDIKSGTSLIGPRGTYDGNDLYVEDAIPPDGADYTVGDLLPEPTDIEDGHYHRQTYTNVAANLRPPERLIRWFADIQRWKVIEVNQRRPYQAHKQTVAKILASGTARNVDDK